MARLENGSYDEIVGHLERKLEFNALDESDALANGDNDILNIQD